MIEQSRAFETEHGFQVENGPFVTGGAASPVGLTAGVDTLYLQTTGSGILLWKKFDVNAADWRRWDSTDLPFDPAGTQLVGTNVDSIIRELATLLNSIEHAFPFNEFACGYLPIDPTCFNVLDGGDLGQTYDKVISADGGNL